MGKTRLTHAIKPTRIERVEKPKRYIPKPRTFKDNNANYEMAKVEAEPKVNRYR